MLHEVIATGRTLDVAISEESAESSPSRDRALARELAYGVVRWYPRLDAIVTRMLERPLRARDLDVKLVVMLGFYQLLHTRIPPHAAVAETVALARRRSKPWATSLVNAVLRRFQRDRESLVAATLESEVARYAHPRWLIRALRADWPEHADAVLEAGNQRAPLTLRVNRLRTSRDAYRELLAEHGIGSQPSLAAPDAIMLDQPRDVASLPGFAAGLASVQDAAAQLAAGLLDPGPGERVLDACAAPGGKATHLLERQPGIAILVAADRDAGRLARVEENLDRLQLTADLRTVDAASAGWWEGDPFDCILVDAPCSGTGVIRRHPDIKIHRRADDVARLAAEQRRLLDGLWRLLTRGGKLLYATCSVLRAENDAIVAGFVEHHPDAAAIPIEAPFGTPTEHGRQVLPGEDRMDGFYYALLTKR